MFNAKSDKMPLKSLANYFLFAIIKKSIISVGNLI